MDGDTVDGLGTAKSGFSLPDEEEEEEGPFYVPLGPTHMFPYPAEERKREVDNSRAYRVNKAFISRFCTNSPKFQETRKSATGERSPSVGSYRDESRLWTPQNVLLNHDTSHRSGQSLPLATRLMSPWKDDDDEVIANLKRRSRSAGMVAEVRKYKSGILGLAASQMKKPYRLFPSLINTQPRPLRENYVSNSKPLAQTSADISTCPSTVAQSSASISPRGNWMNKVDHLPVGLSMKDSYDLGLSQVKCPLGDSRTRVTKSRKRWKGMEYMNLT